MVDMYSSSVSIPAVLVVVVWGVGGAATVTSETDAWTERDGRLAEATKAAIFFLGSRWLWETVDASAAFRFLVRGGMVAVLKGRGEEADLSG